MQEMKLQDLKTKSPTELLSFAEEVSVENASAQLEVPVSCWVVTEPRLPTIDVVPPIFFAEHVRTIPLVSPLSRMAITDAVTTTLVSVGII